MQLPTNLAISHVARRMKSFNSSFEVDETNRVEIFNQHVDAANRLDHQGSFLEIKFRNVHNTMIPRLFAKERLSPHSIIVGFDCPLYAESSHMSSGTHHELMFFLDVILQSHYPSPHTVSLTLYPAMRKI